MAKILVIDDDAELLEMLRFTLEQRGGHEVLLSADGEEGINLALKHAPDLAIVDLMMPGMTGYDVCRRLRAEPSTASLPILVLTARGQPIDRQAALEAGATEFLVKPTPVSELLSRVDSLLVRSAKGGGCPSGVVVLLGLRGGTGVTTLGVNLAAALTQPGNRQICIVDLCPSSGHVALQLGLRPTSTWARFVESEQLSTEVVMETLLVHEAGLRVLAAPVVPVVGKDLRGPQVETLLDILRQRFDVVVVDAPPVLSEAAIAAVIAARCILLITTGDPPALQTLVGTMRALKPWEDKLQIVLNHPSPAHQWPAEGITRVVGRTPVGEIPFDPAQVQALKKGRPLTILMPEAPLPQAVQGLIRAVVHHASLPVPA